MIVSADPFLKIETNPSDRDKITPETRIRLEINGTLADTLYPVNMDENGNIFIDVQEWEGTKTTKAEIGNPWPGLPGVYKWSGLSDPLEYEFPSALGIPTLKGIVSGNSN